MGRAKTQHLVKYTKENFPLRIRDTVRLEIMSDQTSGTFKDVWEVNDKYGIKVLLYCVNCGSNRYQTVELKFLKHCRQKGIPIIIVLTQCIEAGDEVAEMAEMIRRYNSQDGIGDIEIVPVLAQD